MDKILSIAVPSYNSEKYLEKCLSSFECAEIMDKLEIIVINDGSTDRTLEIARHYAEKWPQSFVVIDKENGGHGSGINAAAKIAQGKYFRVVDSDDWVLTDNLPLYIEQLDHTDADVVLTNFHRVNMITGKRVPVAVPKELCGNVMSMDQVMEHYGDVRNCFTIHGIAYKLDIYLKSGMLLSEKVFYEDNEYTSMPFCLSPSVLCLDFFWYQYLVGNVEQSVSVNNQVKRRPHARKVIESMLQFRMKHIDMSEQACMYYDAKLSDTVFYYYMSCLIYDTNRQRGYADMCEMRSLIERKAPFLVKRLNSRLTKLMLLYRLHIDNDIFDRVLESKLYDRFRKILRK